jgi:hypothetical protein
MKYIYIILILFPIIINSQNLSNKIQKATLEYKQLFLNKNFETLSEFASPKLIEYLKSKQDLVFLFSELTKEVEIKGLKILDVKFGTNSEILNYKNQLQSTVPFSLEIEDNKKKVIFTAGLALISFNNGETWFYTFKVETESKINNEILDLDVRIIIPERTQNVINK